jgi:hypothetical protein
MARNKNGAPVGTVIFRMPIDPRQRLSNILDLVAPGDSRLQTVIDERHAYPPSSVKTPNVTVRIGASKLQCFVAPPPTAAMNEDQDWPASALGDIEVQTMLARVRRRLGPIVQILVHLGSCQDRLSIEEANCDPFRKSAAAHKRKHG